MKPLFDRKARAAFVIACITLLVCGVGFKIAVAQLNVYLDKKPVNLREALANIPKELGQWKAVGNDVLLEAASVEELGTDKYLTRQYAIEGKPEKGQISLHIAYYTGQVDAVPHVPDRCLVAAGWIKAWPDPLLIDLPLGEQRWETDREKVHPVTGEPYRLVTIRNDITGDPMTVRMPDGDFLLRTTMFRSDERRFRGIRLFAGYFFVANGRTTAIPAQIRLLAFDKTDEYAYYCKIQLSTMMLEGDADTEAFVALASDFVSRLLPQVMRCLPDWGEVSGRDQSSATES